MDLKALIAKMDLIESKQILNEGFPTVADAKARADKGKTTGKFDKKELSTGTQYTRKSSTFDDGGKDKDQKKAEKKKKNESFFFKPGGIAHHLLSEFHLVEAPVPNPYKGADAEKFAAMSPEDQAWLTKGGGVPDINDAAILARAPKKGAPAPAPAVSNPQNPGGMSDEEMLARQNPGGLSDEEILARQKPAAGAAAAPAMTAADQEDADMGAAMTANTQAANGVNAAGQNVTMPGGINPETGAPTVTTAGAPAAPAAGGKTQWPADKAAIIAFQKANKLTPDGLIGKNTMAALQKAGATPPPGFKPVGSKAAAPAGQAAQPAAAPVAGNPEANQTAQVAARTGVAGTAAAGGGRGGQGGPTAAQAAQAGNPQVAKIDAEIKRFSAKNDMTNVINQNYVKNLEAKKAAASGGGQAAQPAKPATTPAQDMTARVAAAGGAQYGVESVRNEDDAILERIRTALFRR